MEKTEKINALMQRELAQAMLKEIEAKDYLVTLSFVKCSPDLKTAKVGVSILPTNFTGTALRELRKKSGILAKELRKKTKWKRVPTLEWKVDRSAEEDERMRKEIEEIIK